MVKIEVKTVPEKKADEDSTKRVEVMLEKVNIFLAKSFKIEPIDVSCSLFLSTGSLRTTLDPNFKAVDVFSGYLPETNQIIVVHPRSVDGLFTDLWKEMEVVITFALIKQYLTKKYFPNENDYKMYHKYMLEVLSGIVSGKLKEQTVRFNIKMHQSGKFYSKEKELEMVFYIMKKYSGVNFIFDNLDIIMKDLDIKKSIFTIYRKNFDELIMPEKEKILEEDKKVIKTFRPGRR